MSFLSSAPKISEKPILKVENYADYKPFSFKTKRALLCYLPSTLAEFIRTKKLTDRFSNDGLAIHWPRVLNELGYTVDVIGWNETNFRPSQDYDLVIFHGGSNFEQIYPFLGKQTKVVHFLTGSYWKFNNREEDKRLEAFYKRKNVKLARDRYIAFDEDIVNKVATGIIILGNKAIRDTFPAHFKTIAVNNASYPSDRFNKAKKDYATCKKNFLFFAGAGNIHKGLDLAIEAFSKMPSLNLHIITVAEEKFRKVYKKELSLPNIFDHGEVAVRSELYYSIADQCGFVLLPSCAEGQPGSVIDAMWDGLIPITSVASGMDSDRYGYPLKTVSSASIKSIASEAAGMSEKDVRKMSINANKVAKTEHTPEVFAKMLKEALIELL